MTAVLRHPLESLFGETVDGVRVHWLGLGPPAAWAAQLQVLQAVLDHCPLPLLVVSQVEAGGSYAFALSDSGPGLHHARAAGPGLGLLACEQLALCENTPARPIVVARTLQLHGPGLADPAGVLRPLLDRVAAGEVLEQQVHSLVRTDVAVARLKRLAGQLAGGDRPPRFVRVGPTRSVRTSELAQALTALTDRPVSVDQRTPDVRCEVPVTGAPPDLQAELHLTLRALGLTPHPPTPPRAPMVPAIHPRLLPDNSLAVRTFDVLGRRWLSNQGPNARAFEQRIADRTGAGHVIAVGSGSAALLVAAQALGLTGAAVLPAFTFLATASAVVHAGLTPVFCDIDPHTWTLCPDHLARILAARDDVSLVLPVTTFGVPPDLDRIHALAHRAGARVLHDACHAFGSTRSGQPVLGQPGLHTLSLHATKILSAVEGGLVCTHDAHLAREVRQLANYGFPPGDRRAALPAFNFHFDELRAEVGHHSLDHADTLLAQRAEVARRYRAAAARFQPQVVPAGVVSGFQEVGVCFAQADTQGIAQVVQQLADRGVQARRYFHPPLHEVAALGATASLPATDRVARQVLCLPVHPHMPEREIALVVDALEHL